MATSPIIIESAALMSRGIGGLPSTFRLRQTQWLIKLQRRDGGYAGRRGESNMYYTGFAIRLAQLLDIRSPDFWNGVARYLRLKTVQPKDLPDAYLRLLARPMLQLRGITLWPPAEDPVRIEECMSLVRRARVAEGYVRRPGGSLSVYQAFHAAVCYELIGETVPNSAPLLAALLARQRPDGGFVDMPESADESGINPTAAAVSVIKSLGGLDRTRAGRAASFAASMQRPDGGFAAHSGAPMSDLLSTFAALFVLGISESMRLARLGDAGRYARRLAVPDGGFLGVLGDDEPDIEYTYYGVSALATLAGETTP